MQVITNSLFFLCLGGVYGVGLSYFNLFAVIALALSFVNFGRSSALQGLLLGTLFGIGLCVYSLEWMYVVSEYFGVEEKTRYFFIALIYLGMSITYGVAIGVIFFVSRFIKNKWMLVLSISGIWLFSEWVRTWVYTGFPYFEVSYAFLDTWLSGYFPVIGSLGVSWVVGLIAALLILTIKPTYKEKIIIAISVLLLFLFGYFLSLVSYTEPLSTVSVRLINGKVTKEDKGSRQKIDDSIQEYLRLSTIEPVPDLVVWPESAIPSRFYKQLKKGLADKFLELKKRNTEILLGTSVTELEDEIRLFNTAIVGNDINKRYYKRHRVPFGEYLPVPFRSYFPPGFLEDIDEGPREQSPIELNDMVIASVICFEILFPSLVNSNSLESNLIVNISDYSWFRNDEVARRLVGVARVRALENGKYLLRADNQGISTSIDDKGGVIHMARSDELYIDTQVTLRAGQTPFSIYGVMPLLIIMLMLPVIYITLSGLKFVVNKFKYSFE